MRRWGLVLALLLSLGVNVGILATLATQRAAGGSGGTPAGAAAAGVRPAARRRPGGAPAGAPAGRSGGCQRLARGDAARRRGAAALPRRSSAASSSTSREERRVLAELHRELRRSSSRPRRAGRGSTLLVEQIGRSYAKLEGAMAANVVDSRAVLDREQERLFLEFVRRLRAGQGRRFRPGGARSGRKKTPPRGGVEEGSGRRSCPVSRRSPLYTGTGPRRRHGPPARLSARRPAGRDATYGDRRVPATNSRPAESAGNQGSSPSVDG